MPVAINRAQRRRQARAERLEPTGNHSVARPEPKSALSLAVDAAITAHQAGQLDRAASLCRDILAEQGDHPDALNVLAMLALQTGDYTGAINLFEKLTHRFPNVAAYRVNLGGALLTAGRPTVAANHFHRAMRLHGTDPEALNNLGVAMRQCGDPDGATEAFRRALAIRPNYAEAHFNLGSAFRDLGEVDRALASYRRALVFRPDFADARRDAGLLLLSQGRLAEGWAEFEFRPTIRSLGPFADRVWRGDSLSGRTVLVWGEQGIGDQMMFATCLPDIIRVAGHVLVECDRRLVPLFSRSFPAATVHGEATFAGAAPLRWASFDWLKGGLPVDRFVMLGSLPRFFRPRMEAFGGDGAVLRADTARVAEIRKRLCALASGPFVGVAWRSLDMTDDRPTKYPPLKTWAPLFARPHTTFVSLQVAPSEDERQTFRSRFGVELVTLDDLDLANDIDGTAALIATLDAVVSADTYIPMLAGGLGVPAWRVTRGTAAEDWSRLGRERYPWFAALQVRFAMREKDLLDTFAAIAGELPAAG